MQWIVAERAACYADEYIIVKSTVDKSVLFTGIIKGLKFFFDFSVDNIRENNSVRCSIPGLADCRYYPFHILDASVEECKGQYDRIYEDDSDELADGNYSQHTFSFEKLSGETLFTARLLKKHPEGLVQNTRQRQTAETTL